MELMVTVAVLGIAVVVLGGAAESARRDGLAVLQRELAAQLLEYHADRLAKGDSVNPTIEARLAQGLPGASVATSRSGALTTVTVQWKGIGGRTTSLALGVFAREAP